ncbi:DgyrCDS4708 [Dimorphilus gyrociliatus]|uniref:DgyrCDS4708 n=1 Tax=Dimorphilus gyrociliatus TaxID=2664684 RepID=A0A7I8VKF3_9ANNE|nr:DgyrCDS4708 [Dimorphilus gyrociliatus]
MNYSFSFNFDSDFKDLLKRVEQDEKKKAPAKMKAFSQSNKAQKTVSSMIIKKNGVQVNNVAPVEKQRPNKLQEDEMNRNIEKMKLKKAHRNARGKPPGEKPKPSQSPVQVQEKVSRNKSRTVWPNEGKSAEAGLKLDYSGEKEDTSQVVLTKSEREIVGTAGGEIRDIGEDDDDYDVDISDEEINGTAETNTKKPTRGFFSSLTSLIGSKSLEEKDISPIIGKMKEHLISKNVAAETAEQLCGSVSKKLIGKVLGTFKTVQSTVKEALYEGCVQILSPKRRVDILRDALDARANKRPYAIVFCGVNGVGKSTNLAKIAFWLIENGLKVSIAACDTFRAGAVEQLRTHVRKLNALHPVDKGPETVNLFERGYGKDPAAIAMEAIAHARDTHYDVVLIDTAGRMQDNEPLMRALSKLIKVNQPDLVLFVGEALVGNDAVDQLMKFNQSLADFSNMENPRLIDGIVLTKFDTIDDKVGACISMTYTTGQPIIFVGTGQTYSDLKNLNATAVVNALLR